MRATQPEGLRHCMIPRHRLQTKRACVAETKNVLQANKHAAGLGWQSQEWDDSQNKAGFSKITLSSLIHIQ